jgi:hypothetical protein
MRRYCILVLAVVMLSGLPHLASAQANPPESQPLSGGRVLGSVTQGNTTIVFEAANPSDIDSSVLRTWDSFAEEHPRIARALAFKPSLMHDKRYLKRHPELRDFLQEHPEVREAMAANPGNFAAIPPRPGE